MPTAPKRSQTGHNNSATGPRGRRAAAAKTAAARARRTRLVVIAGVIVLVAVIAVAVKAGRGGSPGVADPARFDLPALTGGPRVRLADYRGKPVVVNMFASWCTQCRAELPGFTKAARDLTGKVTFIEVNSQETGDGAAMANEFGFAAAGMIQARDLGPAPASAMHDALGARGMPVTVFYDANGKLLDRTLGALSGTDLRSKLHQLAGV